MNLQIFLSSILFLTFLPAIIAGILFSLTARSKEFGGFKEVWAKRLIHLTTALITLSQFTLTILMIRVDTNFQIVVNSSASWMPVWQRIGASWADRWGSYHLWTWFTWIVVSVLFLTMYEKYKEADKRNIRFFEILLWSSIIILFLLMGQRPYRAVEGSTDPRGLTPSLLSIWNLLHPPIAFASYTGFFISWAITSFIWMYKPDFNEAFIKDLIILDKLTTRITWVVTSLMLAIGMVWSHEATWGGYWDWDSVQIIALILWILSGYRLHLHNAGKNQALYLFLGVIGFPLVYFAAWIITSNVLAGLHSYAGAPIAPLFLFLTFATLVPLIPGFIKHKWKPLSPVKTTDDIANANGFNLGVMGFNFLIVSNFAFIILQIANENLHLGRDYEAMYPLINGLGFSLIAIGLAMDSIQHKRNSVPDLAIASLLAILIVGIQFAFDHPLNEGLEGFIQSALIALFVFTIVVLVFGEINRYRMRKMVKLTRLVSHLAFLLILLTVLANGAGPSTETREQFIMDIGETTETEIERLRIRLDDIEGPIISDQGTTILVKLIIQTTDKDYERTIEVIDQADYPSYVQAVWVTLPSGLEVFITLVRSTPLRRLGDSVTGANLIVEQYFLTKPLWTGIFLFSFVPFTFKIEKYLNRSSML